MNKNLRKYGLNFDKSISRWDEGIALGNGKCGSIIYGEKELRFSLDRIDLWENKSAGVYEREEYNYKNLIDLVSERNEESYNKVLEIFENGFIAKPYPTKITAGRLQLSFNDKIKNIKSKLDIEKALADIEVETEKESIKVQSFMSAVKFCGVIRVYGKFSKKFIIPRYISGIGEVEDNDSSIKFNLNRILNYEKAEIIDEKDFTYFRQKTLTDFEYGVVFLTKKYDGYYDIYYDIVTNKDDENYIEYAKKRLTSFAEYGYDNLLIEHIKWWKKYWKKSDIEIADKEFEKQYYLSYYYFASTSRKGFYPMPLQGVWTADNGVIPPWRGDYHHDSNTELSYISYLKANRLEEGKVFVDYIWSLKDKFKAFAKKFYGVNGYLTPGTASLSGEVMAGWTQYSLSPMMTVWVAQCFDEYYLYTDDMNYLKNRAYPFLKGVASGILGILKEKDGKLLLPLSTSPEVFDGTLDAYLEPNSNFDQALLIYLFKTLIRYCKILNKDYTIYQNALDKLEPLHVNSANALKVNRVHDLPYSHRHLSHLMAIYPLHLLNYDNSEDKKIIDASIKKLEVLGEGRFIGWAFTMSALIYSMAGNGNASREKLSRYVKAFLSPNGFHLNGDYKNLGISVLHYRPFTLEGQFSYCDAIQEMLLQENRGYISLFPAIPYEWEKSCSFTNFRSYGGVIISAKLKNGKTSYAKLLAKNKRVVKIKNTFNSEKLTLKKGDKSYQLEVKFDEVFEVEVDRKKLEIFA